MSIVTGTFRRRALQQLALVALTLLTAACGALDVCTNGSEVALGKKESQGTQGLIYSRLNNPELEILEERLALWEKAEKASVFASGMAAISTMLRPSAASARAAASALVALESLMKRTLPIRPTSSMRISRLRNALFKADQLNGSDRRWRTSSNKKPPLAR